VTRSPLLRDTLALAGVLLEELERTAGYDSLRRRLSEGVLRLLDHVTLALGGYHRASQVHAADAELRALRAHLLLAFELGLVGEELFVALGGQADAVGRQIGGWLKKLEAPSADRIDAHA
jgi:hypothetical protein